MKQKLKQVAWGTFVVTYWALALALIAQGIHDMVTLRI